MNYTTQDLTPEAKDFFEQRIKYSMQANNKPRENFSLCDADDMPLKGYGQKQINEYYRIEEYWTQQMLQKRTPFPDLKPLVIIRWFKFIEKTNVEPTGDSEPAS